MFLHLKKITNCFFTKNLLNIFLLYVFYKKSKKNYDLFFKNFLNIF
jgi:hypothetical protein